jgi:hypothetical protein
MEIIPQILDALIGEIPVIMAPSKLLSDISTRLQRL